jgi:FkbM family methyltransferase
MQQVTYHTLTVDKNVQYKIAVRPGDPDPIGQSIAEGTFAFPPPFLALFALMRPGWRVLDLGAHIGTFSLAAAAQGCEVVSVEASPWNMTLLQASVQKNSFKRIQVANVAVSDHSGTLEFIQAGPFGLVANPALPDATITVPAITVDDLLVQMGWDRVDLIKMDVEGSEVAAIRGMPRLLSRTDAPVILYESNGHTLHYFDETPRSLLAAFEKLGYRSYIPGDHSLVPFSAAEFQPEGLVDYLAIKQLPAGLQDWQVLPALTQEEIIQKILRTCNHSDVFQRIFMARALSEAGEAIARDPRVVVALSAMRADSDPRVRAEATHSWALAEQEYRILSRAAALELEMMLSRLTKLKQEADVMSRDYQVRSHIPLIGGLIAWVRRNLTSHLREPYLDPTLERQVAFNQQVIGEMLFLAQRQTAMYQHLVQLESSQASINEPPQ